MDKRLHNEVGKFSKPTRAREERWLLVKLKDDEADARHNLISTTPESVLSGRTLEEIKAEEE